MNDSQCSQPRRCLQCSRSGAAHAESRGADSQGAASKALPYRAAGLDEREAAAFLLDRLTFGARPGRGRPRGRARARTWLAQQLTGALPEPRSTQRLAQYEALGMTDAQFSRATRTARSCPRTCAALHGGLIPGRDVADPRFLGRDGQARRVSRRARDSHAGQGAAGAGARPESRARRVRAEPAARSADRFLGEPLLHEPVELQRARLGAAVRARRRASECVGQFPAAARRERDASGDRAVLRRHRSARERRARTDDDGR